MKNKFLIFIGCVIFITLFGASAKAHAAQADGTTLVGTVRYTSYWDRYMDIYIENKAYPSTWGATIPWEGSRNQVDTSYYDGLIYPFVVFTSAGSGYVQWTVCAPRISTYYRYNNLWVTFEGGDRSHGYTNSYRYTFSAGYEYFGDFKIPVFNNINEALKYSRGQSYDRSKVIAGTIPSYYIPPTSYAYSDDASKAVRFSNAEYNYGASSDRYRLSTNYNATGTTNKMRATFSYSIPTLESLTDKLTGINADSFMKGFYEFQRTILNEWAARNTFVNFDNSYRWNNNMTYVPLDSTFNVDESKPIILSDFNDTAWFEADEIGTKLEEFYGSADYAKFVLKYLIRPISIGLQNIEHNESTNVYTAYPMGWYYFDYLNYDGTIYKKRGFAINVPITETIAPKPSGTPTSPIQNVINQTQFDNTAKPTSYPEIDSSISEQVEQRYDTIVNEGDKIDIYIDNVNNKLDEWWKDGDLNIDDNISNVYSLLKSVTHIGALFGAVFAGFIPAQILTLIMFAILLIPVILLIKWIRG